MAEEDLPEDVATAADPFGCRSYGLGSILLGDDGPDPRVRLVFTQPTGNHVEVALRRVNTLGRHPDNVIQVLHAQVSAKHCVIEKRANDYYLRDVGSLNGTYVGKKVAVRLVGEHRLRHQDIIWLGSQQAEFRRPGRTG